LTASQVATLLFSTMRSPPRRQPLVLAFALELDAQPQLVLRVGVAQRILVGDRAGLVQLVQRLVEGLMPRRVERDITS